MISPRSHLLRPASFSLRRENDHAVALVIVLAFVVLLLGLALAFFSSTLLYRQISNSSASEAKVDLFAQGAVDTIVGDLKQEIAAGSTITSPSSGVNIYTPTVPQTAIPSIVAPVPRTYDATTKAESDGLNNLVKGSYHQQPFYTGTSYNANFAASSRAVNSTTTLPSQNGRSISLARWNKALFIPKNNSASTNDTDLTPVAAFAAPDWVLVARDGSNPTGTFNNGMVGSSNSTSAIVGRYAYTIYNEGGVLDANVAGYPRNSFGVADTKNAAYKNSLAFADLTQLPGITPARQTTVFNSLVGWRNYATAQPTGGTVAGSNFTFTSASLANFTSAMLSNATGFLTTNSTAIYKGQTDRMFTSRQELLRLFLGGIATQGSAGQSDRANIQNTLQFLGTFSREMNQPSLVPATSFVSTPKPSSASLSSGGNDAANLGGDLKINAPFLSSRVATPFTRNDGSMAANGDPLVVKRFALSRLAWLTFKGPIADDNGNLSTDTAIQTLIALLESQGISAQLLQQGGPTNIKKYFGLSWITDSSNTIGTGDLTQKWKYIHGASGTSGPIQRLDQITGRDPDFVELLKAAVTTGAIAKPAAAQPPATNPNTPTGYQAQRDASTDGAIIQLAANIVDEFDPDSFATRIIFDDGSYPAPQEFRGVEDVPYLYRMRGSLIKLHESDPIPNGNTPGPTTVKDAGLGAFVEQPEIWNPHAWNPSVTQTPVLKPSMFRAIADSTNPFNVAFAPQTSVLLAFSTNNGAFQSDQPSATGEPKPIILTGVNTPPGTGPNTELDFQIPSSRPDLFREPTLLIKPNVPAGSLLTTGSNHFIRKDPVVANYLSGGALKSYYQWDLYTKPMPPVTDDQSYLGFYLGCVPLWFQASINGNTSFRASTFAALSGNPYLTYRLQYLDPAGSGLYVTYDEKFAEISCTQFDNANGGALVTEFGGGGANAAVPSIVTYANYEVYCDPRTARFGAPPYEYQANARANYFFAVPSTISGYNYINAGQNAMWTVRPDEYGGWPGNSITLGGFYDMSPGGNDTRYGLFSQNDPNAPSPGGEFYQDGQGGNTGPQYYADPDGIVRRAMGGYITPSSQPGGNPSTLSHPLSVNSTPLGLPLTATTSFDSTGKGSPNSQAPNRPIVLNRPFRSVADLGYTFSGTPWKNIDFSRPESGFSGLLDVFCINDTSSPNGLAAGKLDLNTRQVPVLQAVLAGATKDEFKASTTTPANLTGGTVSEAATLAMALYQRTSGAGPTTGPKANTGAIPLTNTADLIGRWSGAPVAIATGGIDGTPSYDGYSADLSSLPVLMNSTPPMNIITRYREATVRALVSTGQTRVWNLMIDLVAQTGRYPASASSATAPFAAFNVEGEQRYWVHLAIDRDSGQVVDKQIEVVKE